MKKMLLIMLSAFQLLMISGCSAGMTGEKNAADSEGNNDSLSSEEHPIPIKNDDNQIDKEYSELIQREENEQKELEYYTKGYPRYQLALKQGLISADAPKLSYDDLKTIEKNVMNEIENSSEDYSPLIVERINKIQPYADRVFDRNLYTESLYYPDADNEFERREEIAVTKEIGSSGYRIAYVVKDDDDNVIFRDSFYPPAEPETITPEETPHEIDNPDNMYIGEAVLIPADQQKTELSKADQATLSYLEKEAQSKEHFYGEFVYQKKIVQSEAKENMRKIKAKEIYRIVNKAEIDKEALLKNEETAKKAKEEWGKNIVNAVREIQYYPDAVIENEQRYFFWPDGDSIADRREEIELNVYAGILTYRTFSADNSRVAEEQVIFNLKKET